MLGKKATEIQPRHCRFILLRWARTDFASTLKTKWKSEVKLILFPHSSIKILLNFVKKIMNMLLSRFDFNIWYDFFFFPNIYWNDNSFVMSQHNPMCKKCTYVLDLSNSKMKAVTCNITLIKKTC